MPEIESETKFIWKLILHVLLLPFKLVLVLFGKKNLSDATQPLKDVLAFAFEPKFTISMIIINMFAFVGMSFVDASVVEGLITYPSDILSSRFYTIFTSGFLHANLAHLLGNMAGLFIFGRVVERKLGAIKTALVYFGALLISGVFSSFIYIFVIGENVGGLGASGALMGLIATAILLDPFYFTYELIVPIPIMVLGWLTLYADIVGILNPTADGIGHFAHIGGFISIAFIMFFLSGEDKSKLKKGLIINAISIVLILISYFYLMQNGLFNFG